MTDETKSTDLAPSIVVLKTGDKLIALLQEVFEGEGDDRKGICILMNYPYELSLSSVPNPESPEQDLQVKFSKWCPYSTDSQYRIPYDGILTVGQADPGLASAYKAKIQQSQEISRKKETEEEPAVTPEVV